MPRDRIRRAALRDEATTAAQPAGFRPSPHAGASDAARDTYRGRCGPGALTARPVVAVVAPATFLSDPLSSRWLAFAPGP